MPTSNDPQSTPAEAISGAPLSGAPLSGTPMPPNGSSPAADRRRTRQLLLFAAIALVGIVVGAWLLLRGPGVSPPRHRETLSAAIIRPPTTGAPRPPQSLPITPPRQRVPITGIASVTPPVAPGVIAAVNHPTPAPSTSTILAVPIAPAPLAVPFMHSEPTRIAGTAPVPLLPKSNPTETTPMTASSVKPTAAAAHVAPPAAAASPTWAAFAANTNRRFTIVDRRLGGIDARLDRLVRRVVRATPSPPVTARTPPRPRPENSIVVLPAPPQRTPAIRGNSLVVLPAARPATAALRSVALSPPPRAAPSAPTPVPPVCTVSAVVRGQVWFRHENGTFSTLIVGERTPDGRTVTAISPTGVVTTNRGLWHCAP